MSRPARRTARIRKIRTSSCWQVQRRDADLIWPLPLTVWFSTWRQAMDYADRWTHGGERRQSDYTLAAPR